LSSSSRFNSALEDIRLNEVFAGVPYPSTFTINSNPDHNSTSLAPAAGPSSGPLPPQQPNPIVYAPAVPPPDSVADSGICMSSVASQNGQQQDDNTQTDGNGP
jgi:hypothetical protein